MPKKLRQLALSVAIVSLEDGPLILVIFKQVIGLPEGENFILILDDVTMSLINSVCGQFALFDRGCICIFQQIFVIYSIRTHFIKERLHSWSHCDLLCRTHRSQYRLYCECILYGMSIIPLGFQGNQVFHRCRELSRSVGVHLGGHT